MYIKNPSLLSIILITAIVLLLIYIFYKSFIQSAGAILLKQENPSTDGNASLITNTQTYSNPSNFYVVDVVAEDLKVPFFGTAFHINYNPQNYIYDHFTLGDYFSSDDDPLVLVNPTVIKDNQTDQANNEDSNAKIIVGISLKRGELLTKSQGTLLKLYFKNNSQSKLSNLSFTNLDPNGSNNDFSFSNAVFSTFNTAKGERQDIQNITFNP